MHVAVVGAGISGLGTAIALARDGHDVTLLERDATPLPPTPDEAFHWNRRGAPQVHHSHAFLALMRNALRDRLPDVREGLFEAGATEVAWGDMLPDTMTDTAPEPGDEDLVMLCCRRTTFEWVLRHAALETERVDLCDGVTVTGLRGADGNGAPLVTGVHTDRGDIDADLVVDATGRPSHLPQLLKELGVNVTESRSETGIVYLSRFYRLHQGASPPSRMAFSGGDLEYLKIGIMSGDNRTFSITLAYGTDDDAMRVLREPGRFDTATGLIPMAQGWVDPERSEPISGVTYMGGLINRVRHFVVDGRPIALGLVAVGDASVCTNPLYGRGCSLGLVHALLLSDVVREHGSEHAQIALALDEATQRELVPWYVASKQQDEVSMRVLRGEPLSELDAYIRSVIREGVFPASRVDAGVARAWFRTFNLLTPPDGLLTNQEVMGRVLEFWNEREQREPDPPMGPARDEFLEKVGAS